MIQFIPFNVQSQKNFILIDFNNYYRLKLSVITMDVKTQKFDCCPKCFWSDVSLKLWPDFEGRKGIDNEIQIQQIKQRKCETCLEKSNFSAKWLCRKCQIQISGHYHFLHEELCFDCWEKEVNS